jgi:hypothetical protein
MGRDRALNSYLAWAAPAILMWKAARRIEHQGIAAPLHLCRCQDAPTA